ncbi:MAG: tetratricopeptide repeat protein [Terriglobia bacterium]
MSFLLFPWEFRLHRVVLATGGRRALALLLGLAALAAVAVGIANRMWAARALSSWDRETLERAVRLEGDNAGYRHRLGQWEEFSLSGGELRRALADYQRATELNPYESIYWLDLAEALLLAGDGAEAEAALAHALQVDPHTPNTLWRAGNFWLRAGQPARAFPFFRQVIHAQPSLAAAVIQASHRALGDVNILLREVVPRRPDLLVLYLRQLVRFGEPVAAARVWEALVALGRPFRPREVLSYLDSLIRAHELTAALQAWQDLERLRLLSAADAAPGELLHNPDLRAPILNGGFGWRVQRLPHVGVTLSAGRHGPQPPAVVIQFSGEDNLHYRNFFQYVPVEPATRYRFQAWLRAEEITTDSGLRLELADAYDARAPRAASEQVVGTQGWRQVQVELVTGPHTRLLRAGIVRRASRRVENRIRGVVRATEFSLQAVGRGS